LSFHFNYGYNSGSYVIRQTFVRPICPIPPSHRTTNGVLCFCWTLTWYYTSLLIRCHKLVLLYVMC